MKHQKTTVASLIVISLLSGLVRITPFILIFLAVAYFAARSDVL